MYLTIKNILGNCIIMMLVVPYGQFLYCDNLKCIRSLYQFAFAYAFPSKMFVTQVPAGLIG
jgi:hypothetical protein